MATSDPPNMTNSAELQAQLNRLFGSFKAEWLRDDIFELFIEPTYFPDLTTARPCVLEGGRGTGKTTALRGLSYQGQAALAAKSGHAISKRPYIGLYYRINTNHVTAFSGPELTEDQWCRHFAHYVNLLLVDLILEYLDWARMQNQIGTIPTGALWQDVATALNFHSAQTYQELRQVLSEAIIKFEAYINNVRDGQRPQLSLQSKPIDLLTERLVTLSEFQGKQFFFLVDEYENLLDYQQRVFNTLIKQATPAYTFKVGVRELGWRCRSTLNPNEQLIHPADYAGIKIAETLQDDTFRSFAQSVCQNRFDRLARESQTSHLNIERVLPGLTEEEESLRLGVENKNQADLVEIRSFSNHESRDHLLALSPLELFTLSHFARMENMTLEAMADEAIQNPGKWRERYNNYKYSLLFTLRRGKRGTHKYYCGWDVFAQLAYGNIRYLLELVVQSLLDHVHDGKRLGESVAPEIQTLAAQRLGKKYVSELEGLSIHGAQLTKLLLALGRIFGRLAAEPEGHTPEVNQFRVREANQTVDDSDLSGRVDGLLNTAVMHLALVRFSGNKLVDVGDTKDYTYMMHPIYAPFFEFGHRRKRHMVIAREQLLNLILTPKQTIREVLASQNRQPETPLPEQLLLFERFYYGTE
jgi:hypothetical protein